MSLVKCPDCGKAISDTVDACPKCGYKLTEDKRRELKQKAKQGTKIVLLSVGLFFVLFLICIQPWRREEKNPKEVLAEQFANSPGMQEKRERERLAAAGYCGDTLEAFDLAEKYIKKYCHLHPRKMNCMGTVPDDTCPDYDWRHWSIAWTPGDTCELDCHIAYSGKDGVDNVYGCAVIHVKHNNKFQVTQVWRGNADEDINYKVVYEDEKYFNGIEKPAKAQKK